ncbi:hypothetical protein QQ008_03140 [Fulvivirgaceae bacterium BMA10]|uniref:Uncharacterized protein n=1 Tax=Splendidivirga corallicola TaxID=3051826 RepID=A0ABT8KHY2_9BACT|nr:hypothetical protein [Fulvivirgaceae bacterium BMA10]
MKNKIAPKITVRETLQVNHSKADLLNIVTKIAHKYGLEVIPTKEAVCRLQFSGNIFVDLSNVKVVLGFSPDAEKYQKLSSLMNITMPEEGSILLESFERMILGTHDEITIYKEVLKQRINRFKAYLIAESIILKALTN